MPSVQIAGHNPAADLIRALTSMRPNFQLCFPWVVTQAEAELEVRTH